MDAKILLRIDSLLEHIDLVINDTKDCDVDSFKQSNLLLRATCFSLSQIGEQMIRIEQSIGEIYKDLPWREARVLRNFIVHEYENLDYEQVLSTVKNDLPLLKEEFLRVKVELSSQLNQKNNKDS